MEDTGHEESVFSAGIVMGGAGVAPWLCLYKENVNRVVCCARWICERRFCGLLARVTSPARRHP